MFLVFVGGQIVRRKKYLSVVFLCVFAMAACNGNNSSVQNNVAIDNTIESNAGDIISEGASNDLSNIGKDEVLNDDNSNATNETSNSKDDNENNKLSNNTDSKNTDNDNNDQSENKDSVVNDKKDNGQSDQKEETSNDANASDKDSDKEAEEKKPEIKITDMSEEMYVSSAVNVRMGPSVDEKKIGTLSKDTPVNVTGKSDNGWYRIEYNSNTAFVNSQFLISKDAYEKKKAEEEAALIQAQQAAQAEEERQAQLLAEQQAAQEASQQTQTQTTDSSSFAQRVVALCNEQRAANGLGPLTEDATLDSLAAVRANEIVGTFDHTRPDGSSCFTVLNGVNFMAAGENIASGQTTPEEVVNAWMNSEGHRANILSADFNKIGVGYLAQGMYGTSWVQIFTN